MRVAIEDRRWSIEVYSTLFCKKYKEADGFIPFISMFCFRKVRDGEVAV